MGLESVTTTAGRVVSYNIDGAVVTVNLTGVTDAQRLGIMLESVSGENQGSVTIRMGVLSGDTNGDRKVDSADLTAIKSQEDKLITAVNFRDDLKGNGIIDATDVSIAKLKSGTVPP